MSTQADLDWWLELAPTLPWRFARTMPTTPHSYVVRGKTLSEPEFERAVRVIRTFGEPGKFWSRTMIYLIRDGVKFWTMGEPLEECMIINTTDDLRAYGRQDAPRTFSPHHSVYDELACDYDARYDTAECRWENRWVWELVSGHFGGHRPRTLDVGCGTGLLLDLHITAAESYIGVDPSQAMLNELLRKHGDALVYPLTAEEMIETPPWVIDDGDKSEPFDLVVAMFGSPSYFEPQTHSALLDLTDDLLLLMHYEPGYLPDYHRTVPPTLDSSREAAHALVRRQGYFRRIRMGHFEVTTISKRQRVEVPTLPRRVNLSPTAAVLAAVRSPDGSPEGDESGMSGDGSGSEER